MIAPTVQEIQAQQGTRLSATNPWDSYSAELDLKLDPKLAADVEAYSQRHHEDNADTQTKEELAFQREANAETAKQYQWLTPDEYANVEERTGRVMHSSEFITKLRSAGVRCWYVQHPQPQKAVLWAQVESRPAEITCWVQQGQMPELSIMRFDEHGVPLDERMRGWRTCLLQLILKGVISEEKANKTFGRPKETAAYARYNKTLFEWRKRSVEKI